MTHPFHALRGQQVRVVDHEHRHEELQLIILDPHNPPLKLMIPARITDWSGVEPVMTGGELPLLEIEGLRALAAFAAQMKEQGTVV